MTCAGPVDVTLACRPGGTHAEAELNVRDGDERSHLMAHWSTTHITNWTGACPVCHGQGNVNPKRTRLFLVKKQNKNKKKQK